MLAITGIDKAADRRAGKFSLGMAQRLGIAAALLGDPGVLLLDEPVNGLDPEGIRWIRTLLKTLAAEGPDGAGLQPPDQRDGEHRGRADRDRPGRLLAQTTVARLSARGGSLEAAFFHLTDGVTDYTGNPS